VGNTGAAWREAFWKTARQQQNAAELKDVALRGYLGAYVGLDGRGRVRNKLVKHIPDTEKVEDVMD